MMDLFGTALSAVPWPLPVRPSLESLADPEIRRPVALALMQLGVGVLLLSFSLVMRRGRIVAILAALPLIVLGTPSLAPLLVEATPDSYHVSPTGFAAISIADGQRVFANRCIGCHGKAGDGAGGLGYVADLRQPHIWSHPEGDLFWFVSHGIEAENGAPAMPPFERLLPEQTRWSLIDYVHALNAGAAMHGVGSWPRAVPAPEIGLSCAAFPARNLNGLRGKVIRVILGSPAKQLDHVPPVDGIEVVTVLIPAEPGKSGSLAGADCAVLGLPEAAIAYAILAGEPDGNVTQAQFLIDPLGVLRSVWRKGDGDEWTDPSRLLDEVRTICAEPLIIQPGVEYEHHH